METFNQTQFERIEELAKAFLTIADELNEGVSNYLNGSNRREDKEAYDVVKGAEKVFVKAYNDFYHENHVACLNYELAESVL